MDSVAHDPLPDEIEIEVISGDVRRDGDARSSRAPADADADAARSARGPMLAAVTIVGVLALGLGWLIGYSTHVDEVEQTPVTIPETTVAPEEVSLPTVPAPTTTRPRRTTTTTTLAPPATEIAELDERLLGVDLTLIGLELGGAGARLVELDLADGTLTRSDLGRRYSAEALIAGTDWVLIPDQSGHASLFRDGEIEPLTALGPEIWGIRWQEGTDLFWRPSTGNDWGWYGPDQFEQVDIEGEPTGVTVELPFGTWADRSDPRGGVVVQASGKYYALDESGASQIGSGELIALSSGIAVMRDCDAQLRCGLYVTDRVTGDVRRLLDSPFADGAVWIEPVWGWNGVATGTISPDDGMCAITLQSRDGPRVALLDLASGDIVELEETGWPMAVGWSPDSRFMFFNSTGWATGDQGDVRGYDRSSGDVFSVFAEPTRWDALTARPFTATDTDR